MRNTKGFSLVELTVVISIIVLIAGVIFFNISEVREKSRDSKRMADLRMLQSAIELYKQKNGRYPAGCRGSNQWSGQAGTSYACSSGGEYIVGLAPAFIPKLPTDPKLLDGQSGYVYTTNANGTVYKLMARRTVESETVNYGHDFKSCDATDSGSGMCDAVFSNGNKPNHCVEDNAIFMSTYALWGGFAPGSGSTSGSVEDNTEDIICEIP